MKTIRMPQELLTKWLAALRSGEYLQCGGALAKDCGFCCLGVLQMVADGEVERMQDSNGARGAPSLPWLEARGIEFKDNTNEVNYTPLLPTDGRHATEANDGLMGPRLTFAEIADAIEACAEGV